MLDDVPGKLLAQMMPLAVTMRLTRMENSGGSTAMDWDRAKRFNDIDPCRMEALLHKSKKEGESAFIFNETAHVIAVMAFCPGGIRLFGCHFEAKRTATAPVVGVPKLAKWFKKKGLA